MAYRYPRRSKYRLRVKRSKAGLGLFSDSEIKRGDFVVEYFGPVLNDDEADSRGGKYLFALDDELTIDGTARDNIARYINHSCEPNCLPEIVGKRVFIHATRLIKPGEELTYDYGDEYFEDFIEPHGCRCGHH